MNYRDYYLAKKNLGVKEGELKSIMHDEDDFKQALKDYIEMVITLKGHSWCMDVKSERRKMARLLVASIDKFIT